jgi:hypothetical protein
MDEKPKAQAAKKSSRPHSEATWGEIVEVVKSSGGNIEKTTSGYALVRKVGTMILHFPLPINFDPDNPDKAGKPAPNTLDSIQRNLDVRLPYYHVM